MKKHAKPAIRVCSILLILLFYKLSLVAQCPQITNNTLSAGCFNGTTPCDLCPGEVITLSAEGTNLIDGGCVDWYYSDDPGFNPYDGEGNFIACGEITSTFPPFCTVCPKILAIYVDACGTEELNEYMLLSSGSGFNLNNLQVDLSTQNNMGGPQNNDINFGAAPCGWKTPENLLITNLQSASPSCDPSNIIPVSPGGSIPANAIVAVFTSSGTNVVNFFEDLCASGVKVYVVQSACTRTIGAFTNGNGSGLRTQGILLSGCPCSDYLNYLCEDLAPAQNGDYVLADGTDGTSGCIAPLVTPEMVSGTSSVEDVTIEMTEAMCNMGPFYLVGILNPTGPVGCPEEVTPNLLSFNVVCPDAIAEVQGPACFGGNVSLHAEGGGTYKWSGPAGFSSTLQDPLVSNLSTPKNGLYYVTVTNTAGCTDVSSVQLTVNPDITISITPANPSVCQGESITLTGMATGGSGSFTYEWEDPSGSIVNDETIDASVAGVYTFTATDLEGCSQQKTINVTILAVPVVNISPQNITLCTGGMEVLTANASNGTPAYSYIWSNGSGVKTTTINGPGTFNVTVTDSKGCTGTAEVEILEGPAPDVNITPDPAVFCPGLSIPISVNASGGQLPYQYKWNTPSGNQSTQTIQASVAGNYLVTVTDDAGCTGISNINVTQNPDIVISISPDPASFCNGGSIDITASASGGSGGSYTYEWSTPNGMFSGPKVTASEAGIYTVEVTDGENCTQSKSIDVSVSAPLGVTVNPDPASFCPGSFVDLTAMASGGSGTYSYTWSTPSGSLTGQTIKANVTGNYTVTVTDANGCTGLKTINVTQDNNIAVSISPDPASFCSGSSVNLTASSPAGGVLMYQWTTPSGTQTGSSISANIAGNYKVTVTNASGCSGTANINVTQDLNIPVSISPDPAGFCKGGSIVLTASSTATGTLNYTWNTPSGIQSGSIITAGIAGNYKVTVTNSSGCSGTTSIDVVETASFDVMISPAQPAICIGSNIELTATTPAGGTLVYKWTTPSGIMNGQIITANVSGEYIVTVTDQGGCTGTATIHVDEYPGLDIAIDPDPASFCTNGSVALTALNTNGTGPFTYQWTTPIGSGSNQVFSANIAGIYTVTVSDSKGCTGTATTTVSQSNTLSLNFKPVPPGFCNFKTIDLSVTPNGGQAPYSYQWTTPIGNFNTANFTTGTSGSYKVTVTDVNGCSGLGEIIVDQLDAPDIAMPSTLGFCKGSNVLIKPSVIGNLQPFTYQWKTPVGSDTSTSFLATKAGSYYLTVTNSAGCTASMQTDVNEWPTPVLDINPDPVQFCTGNSINVSVNVSNGTSPFNYAWTWAGGSFNGNPVNISNAGDYTVIVSDINGCSASSVIPVTESSGLSVILNTDPQKLCGVPQFNILSQTTGGNQPYQYNWTGPFGTYSTATITANAAGFYYLTVTDASGCSGTNNIIVVNEVLSLEIDKTVPSCNDQNSGVIELLSAINPSYPLTLVLDNNPAVNITGLPYQITGLSSGNFDLNITAANGCTYSETINLAAADLLSLSLGPDITIFSGETVSLNPIVNFTIDSIYWTNSNTLICDPACLTAIATPVNNTTYKAIAFDANGCSTEDEINVYVQEKQSVFVPNTFSPDANGINDKWVIFTDDNVKQIRKLYIYDRWGESLYILENFPANDAAFGWDGKFRGQKMNHGVYVYYFEAEFNNGDIKVFKGDITIVK